MDLDVELIDQYHPYLGRHKVHDPRSKDYSARLLIRRDSWIDRTIRIFDPTPNPNQCHGECTAVAKCVQFNAVGNRVKGVRLDMEDAHELYHLETTIDPFKGEWPPDDTGSSGLASAKAAQKLGLGKDYWHIFNGADGIVQAIQQGHVVSVGTLWYESMFSPDEHGIIKPSGKVVGGHQFSARAYHVRSDLVTIRCWWGDFRDVRIKRDDLNDLVMDGGDAHIQTRAGI